MARKTFSLRGSSILGALLDGPAISVSHGDLPARGSKEDKRLRGRMYREQAKSRTRPQIDRLLEAGFESGASSVHIRVGHEPLLMGSKRGGKPKAHRFARGVLRKANCTGPLSSKDALFMQRAITPTATRRGLAAELRKVGRSDPRAAQTFAFAYGDRGICLVRATATPKKRGLDIALLPVSTLLKDLPWA